MCPAAEELQRTAAGAELRVNAQDRCPALRNRKPVGCAVSSVTDFSQPWLSEQGEKMQA